jgi:23S rRNA maturation-related 3'-5' exoribonuclease YhaM
MPRKPTTDQQAARPRAVTDALRRQVREELPEITEIGDAGLRDKVTEAWAVALAHSSFSSIRDIPPAGNPDVNEARRGDQTDHLRGVTRLAAGSTREMGAAYPELAIDMDIVIAGGLLHDVGKAWEFNAVEDGRRRPSSQGASG